jgi:uncharacterized protein YlxP (DUF503 family)
MYIGVARVSLYIPESFSLKDKRGLLKSAIERTRSRFNAAVSEVEDLDDLRVGTVGITVVSNSGRHADEMLQNILAFMERDARDLTLGEVETEIIPF